ncbi:hypothetical protein KC216_20590, partial [Mycobacterium tuberculosis]|nr:hypothetical protein [Mycobacterium tuberculosis]
MNDLDHPQLIFESTGIYSRGMERFCCVNQINYIQMNPLEAKFKTSAIRAYEPDVLILPTYGGVRANPVR